MASQNIDEKRTASSLLWSFTLTASTLLFSIRLYAYVTLATLWVIDCLSAERNLTWLALSGGLILIPLLTQRLTQRLQTHYPKARASGFAITDAAVMGTLIGLFNFDPAPTLLIGVLASGIFLTAGRLTTVACAYLILGVSALLVQHFLNMALYDTPTASWAVLNTLTLGLLSLGILLLLRRQTTQLNAAQDAAVRSHADYRAISQKLAKYIAPQVWQTIFSGQQDARLETTRKPLVVFFSDIQGFTELSERVEPEVLTQILNEYFEEMTRIIVTTGGTLDKFIGDSLMVFFGDPESKGSAQDAQACIHMAIAMRKRMTELRRRWKKRGIDAELNVRMGVNMGYCTVGNFGSDTRMDYTIIGKEVNLASRLENSAGPNEILISQSVHDLIKPIAACRPKGEIRARGFAKPVPVFEVVGLRRDLGEQSTFAELEVDGFSLQLDVDKLKHYDRERILAALVKAHKHIKGSV
ncbi:adenylate/guanylate cyclase domain-containing protein [Salinispirillum marinum]|uniref:Adenylate/guanylate cyclase domain-containing protein n=2 Tax=Saccharospirillaceae TaxID=255527 RepID=A0ABV8BFS2_9GAMM